MVHLSILVLLVTAANCCLSETTGVANKETMSRGNSYEDDSYEDDSYEDDSREERSYDEPSATYLACKNALTPTVEEQNLKFTAEATCIAQQLGLQATIDNLPSSSDEDSSSDDTSWGNSEEKDYRDHCDLAARLEYSGYTTEADTLRECIATELSMVASGGSFDMDSFKASILSKVTGLAIEGDTQLGLNECPNVDGFDVCEYMYCIRSYCNTGTAPK